MHASHATILKDLVLIGGGHSHVAVLKQFGMDPLPGVRLILICREAQTPYSGMLPGFIAGHYSFEEAHIDLGPLARFAGARFYNDEVTGLDPKKGLVYCRCRPPVPYDLLSINVGSTPPTQTPGAQGAVVPVKPINRFIAHWKAMEQRVLAHDGLTRIGVVGAGAGGVELILSVQHRLQRLLMEKGLASRKLAFHLITKDPDILAGYNRKTASILRRILAEQKIDLHRGFHVEEVRKGTVLSRSRGSLDLDEILWVTTAGAAPWVREAGLEVDQDGFLLVDDTLRAVSHPEIFGAGDIATMVGHPRPKSGVFAVRQGRPLARNLRRSLLGKPLRRFVPQRDFLSIIGTGDGHAVASRGSWSLEGRWAWRWKEWIDRRFMRKYNELPEMAPKVTIDLPRVRASKEVIEEISTSAMRCGGCGAKVGPAVLKQALGRLDPVPRDDVLIGLGEPDDAAVVAVPAGKWIVHTVDSFRAMIDDPYVFGKIATNHCLGDIFAMGGEPQSALAIATIPFGVEAKVADTLTQMMAGVIEVLRAADTALVGGHSGEGAELSLGLAVNGLIDQAQVLRKSGMRPGDRLILTKPLGTGTLFAADMRAKAKGRWIRGAIASMLRSNQEGARCFAAFGATSCSDVTGFGLVGHLAEMTEASKVAVDLDLNAIPVLEGARRTIAEGLVSSLQRQNARQDRTIANLNEVIKREASFPLLFDPQTAGGLLASVPADVAEDCLEQLRTLGYAQSAIIGRVKPSNGQERPITVMH